MTNRKRFACLSLFTAIGVWAASSTLGFITVQGTFQLDKSRIWGNATLLDGSAVETDKTRSEIHLQNGSQIQLAPASKARFFAGHAMVEKGSMRIQAAAAYRVEARGLQIATVDDNTRAGVALQGADGITVSVASGELTIANPAGTLVADVTAGKSVTLTPEPGGTPGFTRLTGCLLTRKSSAFLVDQASSITFQLEGGGASSEAGNRVEITGTLSQASPQKHGQLPMINVSNVSRLEAGACTGMLLPGNRPHGLARVASTKRGVATIGGFAVAGGVGGMELARAFDSQPTTLPDTSR